MGPEGKGNKNRKIHPNPEGGPKNPGNNLAKINLKRGAKEKSPPPKNGL